MAAGVPHEQQAMAMSAMPSLEAAAAATGLSLDKLFTLFVKYGPVFLELIKELFAKDPA